MSSVRVGSVVVLLAASVLGCQGGPAPLDARDQAERSGEVEEMYNTPRPIDAADVVWIDEMTWMEVRDAVASGVTTALIATGGIEQNGPYLVTGKHNVVLRGTCEAIARKLGDALCAPVIKFVPEGNISPPSGHMRYSGTISLRQETYRMLLEDVAGSLAAHGFEHIVFIGDSGGNQTGMAEVAASLNARWEDGHARAHHIPEFYDSKALVTEYMAELGYPEIEDDGEHDNARQTILMMAVDPASVRYEQRLKRGLATINGVDISSLPTMLELAEKLRDHHAELTVTLIRDAMARAP